MIFAQNNQLIKLAQHREATTFNLEWGVIAYKISVTVVGENAKGEKVYGPVILQVTEDEQNTYENELLTEQLLEVGFHSRTYVTPITGFRFRIPNEGELPALIHFVAYG